MLKPILLCCVVGMLIAAANARAQPLSTRSGFHDIIPQNWKMVPPPHGSNEKRFISPRGDAWIVFKARPARRSVAAELALLRTVRAGDIAYEREGSTWIVVSGYDGNRIFYRKAMLACGGNSWHFLEFEYPAVEKRAFDDFVTRSSAALGAYSHSGCDRSKQAEAAQ